MYAKEEAKRMKPAPGNVVVGSSKSIAAAADATEAAVSSPAHHVAAEATSGAFEAEVVAQPKKYGLWRRIRRFGRGLPMEVRGPTRVCALVRGPTPVCAPCARPTRVPCVQLTQSCVADSAMPAVAGSLPCHHP